MLTHLKERFERHMQAAAYGFWVFCQKPFATAVTVAVIGVSLSLPTLFWVIGSNLKQASVTWQEGHHIALYLKLGATSQEMTETVNAAKALPGVDRVSLQTPEQSLKQFEKQEGLEHVIHDLPSNPLPAMIEVFPIQAYQSPEQLKRLETQLKQLPYTEQVRLDMAWIQELYTMLNMIKFLIRGVMLLLSAAIVLIIGNTLRLLFIQRQEEFVVLKLVGATDAYMMRPFLYLGLWYGVFGAVAAIFLVSLILHELGQIMQQLVAAYQVGPPFMGLGLWQAYGIILFSGGLGWLAAQLFVRARLTSIHPT